jgi:hypothetical protein
MSNYTINYSCGHSDDKQLYGKMDDRSRYIAWAEKSGECQACRAANQMALVADTEASLNLAPLTGSDKQIAWARKIRCEKMIDIVAYLEARTPVVGKEEAFAEMRAQLIVKLSCITSAAWWIDNRDTSRDMLLSLADKK